MAIMDRMTDKRLAEIRRGIDLMRSCRDIVGAILGTKVRDELHDDQMEYCEEMLAEIDALRAELAAIRPIAEEAIAEALGEDDDED